jgi:hypothetical protein
MTDLEVMVAVLYVAVVLLAALYYSQRIVLFISVICLALTFVSYALSTHGNPTVTPPLLQIKMLAQSLSVT